MKSRNLTNEKRLFEDSLNSISVYLGTGVRNASLNTTTTPIAKISNSGN